MGRSNADLPWKYNGFERFFDYRSNFIHLNINLGSLQACHAYHDDWMRRYSNFIDGWESYDVAVWSIRLRQALKLCFSATYFTLNAEEERQRKLLAASYYLAYYGMIHAMWAVLYLHPEQRLSNITSITHSKIANVFDACFAHGRTKIIIDGAKERAEDLRFLREYYAYRMPLNSPFSDDPLRPEVGLGGFIKQCIQHANLHSRLITKAAVRKKKASARLATQDQSKFEADFFAINGKEHRSKDLRCLDPADQHAFFECKKIGCDLMPLSLEFEHMFDDYMTWDDESRAEDSTIGRVRSLVFDALH